MERDWTEMKDAARQNYQKSPFVPFASSRKGKHGYAEDFYAVTSCAFPTEDQATAEKQGWMDLGLQHSFEGMTGGTTRTTRLFSTAKMKGAGSLWCLSQRRAVRPERNGFCTRISSLRCDFGVKAMSGWRRVKATVWSRV